MASKKTNPAHFNATNSVGATGHVLITSIARDQTISIDGLQIDMSAGMELYSPVQCNNFYSPYLASVGYYASSKTSAFALLIKYNNFAVTTSTYDFTIEAGEESVVSQIINDYSSVGVDVERLATVEDLIADTDIIDGIGIDNINNVFVKVEDPSKLSPNSSNSYYYDDGVRERNFYLQTNTNGLRHTYDGVHPFSSDNLYIKSWTGARKCLVKLK